MRTPHVKASFFRPARMLTAALLAGAMLCAGAADLGAARACQADAIKLCRSVKPGGGRMVACLQQHEAELAPACKTRLPALSSCSKEILQLCGDGPMADVRSCAQSHVAQLSADCKALAAGR